MLTALTSGHEATNAAAPQGLCTSSPPKECSLPGLARASDRCHPAAGIQRSPATSERGRCLNRFMYIVFYNYICVYSIIYVCIYIYIHIYIYMDIYIYIYGYIFMGMQNLFWVLYSHSYIFMNTSSFKICCSYLNFSAKIMHILWT